jgi:hypothetical protein
MISIDVEYRPDVAGAGELPRVFMEHAGTLMTRHFDQRAIERAAVILRVAGRYSGDELDAALKAARGAIEYCLMEASAEANTGRTLIEEIDAACSFVRNRS